MQERRGALRPAVLRDYLSAISGLVVLDRLSTAMLGVELGGQIVYANQACADLLGYVDAVTLTRLYLPELLLGHSESSPDECVPTLRDAEPIVEWNHSLGHVVRTAVSSPLLMRESDPIVLVGMTDVTQWLWGGG